MSLSVNTLLNNTNNNTINNINNKHTQNKSFVLEMNDKKITEKEDNILYEFYKKDEFAQLNYKSFEDFKKKLIAFPTLTAPGIVRKTWREQWNNANPVEKNAMIDVFMYSTILADGFSIDGLKTEVPKDTTEYLKLMERIKKYSFKAINLEKPNSPEYAKIENVVNKFTNELRKYV